MYTVNKLETFHTARGCRQGLSRVFCLFCLIVASAGCLAFTSRVVEAGTTYYVDTNNPDANDGNPGTTEALPWKTLAKAANTAQAGDTVLVKAGIYNETLQPANSGTLGAMITFKAYPGEECQGEYTKTNCQVVIDGEYTRKPVDLSGRSHIRVEGFEIIHAAEFTHGVYLYNSYGIEIVNNNIHHNDIYTPNYWQGSSGIEVYVAGGDILIKDNDIHHNYKTGIQLHSISLSNLSIINNDIHHNGNDGICQGGGSNWLIEGNRIYVWGGMMAGAHPDGIQLFRSLDGLIIRNNIIWDQHQDITLQPLDGEVIENVEIYNNVFYRDEYDYEYQKGILLHTQGGTLNNISIYGNTVYGVHFGIMLVEADPGALTGIEIRNNIIADITGVGLGEDISSSDINSDYNLFFNEGAITWDGTRYSSLSDFQTATGQDLNSIEADPEFVNPSSFDFHLQNTSPAIDAGTAENAPNVDIVGTTRPQGAGFDIGAYEYQVLNPDTTVPSVPQNLTAQAVSESQIDLSWDASSDPESGVSYYKIYRDGGQIDTSTSTSYSNIGLNGGTTYSYEVSAVNGQGLESGRSNTAQATTFSDATPPSIVSVGASETSVEITFSESLDTISAEDTSNYSITGGISVSVTAASLDTDTVTLTTSAHTEGTYILTVENVQDTSGNAMTKTTTDYEYDDGLIGHWKFDDGSGNSAVDSSDNNNTGTLINGPTWTTGKFNGGLSFDGVDDAVEIGTNNFNATQGTISLWAYAESFSSSNYFFGHTTDPAWANRIQLYTDISGNLGLGLGDTHSRHTNIQTLSPQTWYHISITWDGTNYVVFIDGTARATGAYSGLSTLETYADIGNNGNRAGRTEAFNGIIDEVHIYNRALTAGEILDLYNEGITADTTAPVISDVQSSNVTTSQATITWNTDENSTSQVEYGLDTNYGNSSALDTSLVTSHSALLTGLASETLYHYHVMSKDASGNESISQDNTFPTAAVSIYYSITASASGGGTISPSDTTQVVSGGSQTYDITADTGYYIWDVLVDGSSVGAESSYSFTDVTDNHTITATFAIEITASAGSGGQISPSETTRVVVGGSQTYDITANTGYHISDVVVDGIPVGDVNRYTYSYTFTDVIADHTITANFVAITTYSITATAGEGGSITPSGDVLVNEGENQAFTITADAGYHISDVVVDDGSVGDVNRYTYSYTFTDVTDNHTIAATFAIDEVDLTAPVVANLSPQADSIQAPLNTLVILDIADSGDGVDANSVTVKVNNDIVYSGNTAKHSSTYGECHRIGTKAHYAFIYQSNEMFDFDQPINVTAKATDLAGNVMDEYSYSFKTEMLSFGEKKTLTAGKEIISSGANQDSERPLTAVSDSSGNVWVAWTEGDKGPNNSLINRDIWIGKLTVGAESFESGGVRQVTNDAHDQSNPVLAIDSSDMLYLAWQDERNGKWDLFISTSADGTTWTAEKSVTDPNYNQTNPAMAIDSSDEVYIVYDDDQNTDKDIYIASSADNYVSKTQITSAGTGAVYDQTTPDIAVDSDDTVYVVWADARNWNGKGNIKYDMYGAASDNSWTNIEIVDKDKDGQQTAPKIATEDTGTILHFVWVDDEPGDKEVYYGSSDGLPGTPLTGVNIIDQGLPNLSDGKQPEQKQPALAVSGYTGGTDDDVLKVFACWEDERYNGIENIHAVEMTNLGINIWVGDDGAGNDQKVPAIGIDPYNHPYLVWVNNKSDIIYTGSTFIEPVVLASSTVSVSSKTTVGTVPSYITNIDDVSAEVPQGAYLCDVKVTISKIKNPQEFNFERSTGVYEFGPSGMEFTKPVTITIPYEVNGSENVSYKAYWYNSLTNTLSQQGITDVETIVISSNLHALRFKTTHFSPFILGGALGGLGGLLGGGGGGGGCSMSPNSQDSIAELLLPYIGLAVAMVVLKLRDRRKRKAHNITKSEC